GVLRPDMPGAAKAKIKYARLGSAIPLAVLLGSALATKRRAKSRMPHEGARSEPAPGTDSDQHIALAHGGLFRVGELVAYIEQSGRPYIIAGEVDCAFADHPKPRSLDYWIRE